MDACRAQQAGALAVAQALLYQGIYIWPGSRRELSSLQLIAGATLSWSTSFTHRNGDVHTGVVLSPINAAADASLCCRDPGIFDQIYASHEYLLPADQFLSIIKVMYFVCENSMTCACLQSPIDAADVLAAHGDHKGAAELLEERLLPAWFPEAPLSQALKPAEQQRLHNLWMKLRTTEACTKVSLCLM